ALAACRSAKDEDRPGSDDLGETLADLYDQALDAMTNDLNTPVAIAKAIEGSKAILRSANSLSLASATSGLKFLED
ncbi:hypothetical protein ACSTI7_23290, partial [Vibrio parahaemolyticus]